MSKLYRVISLAVCIGFATMFLGCASTNKHESTGEYYHGK